MSYEVKRALAELLSQGQLPLSETDWAAIGLFYAARKNHEGAVGANQWKNSVDAVGLALLTERDKAYVYLEKHNIPLPGSADAGTGGKKEGPPERWLEFLRAHGFPNCTWAEADGTLRRDFKAWCAANPEAPGDENPNPNPPTNP